MEKILRLEDHLRSSKKTVKDNSYQVKKKRQQTQKIKAKPTWMKPSVSPFDPKARQTLPPAWR